MVLVYVKKGKNRLGVCLYYFLFLLLMVKKIFVFKETKLYLMKLIFGFVHLAWQLKTFSIIYYFKKIKLLCSRLPCNFHS